MIARLAHWEALGGGRYRGAFDASWNQGRGAFGGLLAATLGRCLEREIPERRLRALSMHLCAAAEPGPLQAAVAIEREGSAVTYASARLSRDGAPVVIASATLARPRVGDEDFEDSTPPEAPPADALPDLGTAPGVPAFTRHFDFRFAEGIPFSGQPVARSGGWLRPREAEPLSTPLALALLDAWPLAILPRFRRPRPAASVAIHFQLFPPFEAPPGAWYRAQTTGEVARQGYGDQVNHVWDADGRLIGRSTQLVAVIR